MCFSMLLKQGIELTGRGHEIEASASMTVSLDDAHAVEVSGSQESLFEVNDDFILTTLSHLPTTIKFSEFFLGHMHYVTPSQLTPLRPPSTYLF